jgi:hypothetical protein
MGFPQTRMGARQPGLAFPGDSLTRKRIFSSGSCSFFVLANWALKEYSHELKIFLNYLFAQGGPTKIFILVFLQRNYRNTEYRKNWRLLGSCLLLKERAAYDSGNVPPLTLQYILTNFFCTQLFIRRFLRGTLNICIGSFLLIH